jgi:hypothetical protein
MLDISGKQVKINAHGSQAGMPQNFLQAEDVPPVKQVVLGKGMPESMR